MSTNQPIRERFEGNFMKGPGCWLWKGGLTEKGYGRFKSNYLSIRAHRFAYELYIGPIPKGLLVLHMCDNPSCVNPEHLTVGDQVENVKDCLVKGRRGKLKPEHVLQIRELLMEGNHVVDIAAHFGVGRDAISHIAEGKSWSHVR